MVDLILQCWHLLLYHEHLVFLHLGHSQYLSSSLYSVFFNLFECTIDIPNWFCTYGERGQRVVLFRDSCLICLVVGIM